MPHLNPVLSAENILTYLSRTSPGKRGINIYHVGELLGVTGRARDGSFIHTTVQQPWFSLTIIERMEIFRRVDMIHGVITSRMNRVSGLDWQVICDVKHEDRLASELKQYKQMWDEFAEVTELPAAMMRKLLLGRVRQFLPDVRPDMNNFGTAMLRWRKRLREQSEDRSGEIESWLQQPNQGETFRDFVKKSVFDLLVHGAMAWYKEQEDKLIENFYVLPGGTVIPIHTRYAGGPSGYVQVFPTLEQPQVYFADEMSYGKYEPNSALSYGTVPLEALINKLAESLLFDEYAANQADGTKPPDKVVVWDEAGPFGDVDAELGVPADQAEQKKIETVLNEARKFAVRTLTGHGTPTVLDISKGDTFAAQDQRQQRIRESVALVFNVSNLEVNLTGSGDTSGRATSESQERLDQKRGIEPIIGILEDKLNRDIIPLRFGPGYHFQFGSGLSETETVELQDRKLRSGLYATNEVRQEAGLDPFPDEEYDRPPGVQKQPEVGSEQNPMFTAPL